MKIAPIPSRFGFVAAARSAFDFVTEPPYSMWLTEQDEGRVGYEGDDVVLEILHEYTHELDIALWRLSDPSKIPPFTISDMIRVADPAKARAYRCFSAFSEDSVRHGVAKLASEFREYGIETLTGGADFYRKMLDMRSEAARQHGIEIVDGATRRTAEQAWHQRDFHGVVEAYSSMEDRLTRVERGRLNYALRQVAN